MHHTSSLDRSEVGPLQHLWVNERVCVCVYTTGFLLWTVSVWGSGKCWSEVCVCVFVIRRSSECEKCVCVFSGFLSPWHLTCSVKCEHRRSDQFRVWCWCEETSTCFFKVTTDLIPADAEWQKAACNHPVHLAPLQISQPVKTVHLWQDHIHYILLLPSCLHPASSICPLLIPQKSQLLASNLCMLLVNTQALYSSETYLSPLYNTQKQGLWSLTVLGLFR